MNYRPLEQRDLIFLDGVREDFIDGWNLNVLTSSFATGNFFGIVACEEENILGFITYTLSRFDADIESVYVVKEKRRQGIASALLKLAIDDIKSGKKEKIFLEVRDNNPAIFLYQKYDFQKVNVRKKYYGDQDAFVLVKEL